MKKGSEASREPQKLESQLDRLLELNPRNSASSGRACSAPIRRQKLRSSLIVQAIAYRHQ